MKAPQYIITNPEINRYNHYSLSLHLSKLKNIKERRPLMNSNTPCPITRSNKKYLNNRINYIEKKQDIYMENKAMFDRLLNISQQSIVNYI